MAAANLPMDCLVRQSVDDHKSSWLIPVGTCRVMAPRLSLRSLDGSRVEWEYDFDKSFLRRFRGQDRQLLIIHGAGEVVRMRRLVTPALEAHVHEPEIPILAGIVDPRIGPEKLHT